MYIRLLLAMTLSSRGWVGQLEYREQYSAEPKVAVTHAMQVGWSPAHEGPQPAGTFTESAE